MTIGQSFNKELITVRQETKIARNKEISTLPQEAGLFIIEKLSTECHKTRTVFNRELSRVQH